MNASIITADHLASAELLDVWNRGFAGYYVDNTLDQARLDKHIRWSGVDLARSAILLVDEQPAAFSLAAIERRGGGLAAWIAGFGVAPEHRRKGLAGQVMRGHCQILDAAGVLETLLEVIEENPARRVYSSAGFRRTRTLLSFEGVPQAAPGSAPTAERLDLAALEELHSDLHAHTPPVWRRELPVLGRILEDTPAPELLGLPGESGYAAYALAVPTEQRVTLMDICAADAEAARRMVADLATRFPGRPLRLIDEPEDSSMVEALSAAEVGRLLTQFEMVRTL